MLVGGRVGFCFSCHAVCVLWGGYEIFTVIALPVKRGSDAPSQIGCIQQVEVFIVFTVGFVALSIAIIGGRPIEHKRR